MEYQSRSPAKSLIRGTFQSRVIRTRLTSRLGRTFVAPLRSRLLVSLEQKVSCVAGPEEGSLQLPPDLTVSPVFAEDVCWVPIAGDVVEGHNPRSDGFPGEVVSKPMVALA